MKNLKVGDVCRVILEWGDNKELRTKKVRIVSFQNNGLIEYAYVHWLCKDGGAEMIRKYGRLFQECELKCVPS
jgi:hypothetical protein